MMEAICGIERYLSLVAVFRIGSETIFQLDQNQKKFKGKQREQTELTQISRNAEK